MKFSIKYFFSKCDQIRSFRRIWSHLLKKSLVENFIFFYSEILQHLYPPTTTKKSNFSHLSFSSSLKIL